MKKTFFSSYTGILLVINVAVFFCYLFLAYFFKDPLNYLALQPIKVMQGNMPKINNKKTQQH